MELEFGVSSFERVRGDYPLITVINMFAEEAPTEQKIALQSRPGLAASGLTMGGGPVRALFQADGVLGNSVFGVSGGALYRDAVLIDDIAGDGHVSFAGYSDFVFVTAGDKLYDYDGTNRSEIPFPDNAPVIKIATGASRLLAIRGDTQKFYWSGSLEIDIEALDFASAENSPDRLFDLLYVGDQLILFGKETVEFWVPTADADTPFVPLIGRVYPVGIRDTGCAIKYGSTFAWVTNQNEICISDIDNKISNPGLEALIEASEICRLWTFLLEGTEFLAMSLDDETWVFNRRQGTWSQFETNEGNWIAGSFAGGYFGSQSDGALLEWSDDYYDVSDIVERRFRAWAPIDSGPLRIDNLFTRTNQGTTPFLSGDYANPILEMRASRDGGRTWTSWKSRYLGVQGDYTARTIWKSCGVFTYPGVLFEFRIAAPVPFRVSKVLVNEPYGGR